MATPVVGCRVRILKDYATVRYIGPVAQQQGTWVGVEWDDPSRGKHDGSTAGVRYFNCSSGYTSGSFVRIERVNFGGTVLEALRARYNNETAEYGEAVGAEELYVHTFRRRRVQVHLVGEEKIQQKQRRIHLLQSARLVGLDVSAVGDPAQLRACVPSLTSLDLTSNLVADWAFVEHLAGQVPGQEGRPREGVAEGVGGRAVVVAAARAAAEEDDKEEAPQVQAALPQLSVLILSENRLTFPLVPSGSPAAARVLLPGLRVLVLNDCGLSWEDVMSVAPSLPALEELHLCGNPIVALHAPAASHPPPGRRGDAPASTPQPPPDQQPQRQRPQQKPHQPAACAPTPDQNQPPGQPHQQGGLLEESQPEFQRVGGAPGAAELAPGTVTGGAAPAAAAAGSQAGSEGASDTGGDGGSAAGGLDEAAAELLAALLPRLQVLTLEDCQLSGWGSLQLLRRLPALARLHLAGNTRITHITYPATATAPSPEPAVRAAEDTGSAATGAAAAAPVPAAEAAGAPAAAAAAFPRLAKLFLGGCGVADWGSVNQLDRFPELRELRLTGNPVLALSKTGGRFEVIGRVSGLQQLNGAEVRPRERRDSELRYLQHIAAEMEACGPDEARRSEVRAAHPRLRKLMELHGAVLATAARGAAGGGSLAASAVQLKLTCVAAAATAKMGAQVKKLPKSTTISALRLLCERLFKVKSDQMALFLRAPGDPLPEDIGAEDLQDRDLGFFGVQDGYEVLVDEQDLETLRRVDEDSRAAAAAAHERRLAEQLRAAEQMQAEFARSMGLQQQSQ